MDLKEIELFANKMRRKIIDISFQCNKSVHIGGALSMVDIMATLYGGVLNVDPKNPTWENRDRFILSKGHGALGLYSALLVRGFISDEIFQTFQTNESDLTTHPVMNLELGIESSNGSLGQGLSMGVGLALAAKKKKESHRVYIYLGDGECNEGSVWEAAMTGSNFRLDNLVAIIDENGFQNDGSAESVLRFGSMEKKWESFGWDTRVVNGHDIAGIYEALTTPSKESMPIAIVAKTTKGKGVAFMENNNDWHHNRLTKTQYETALSGWENKND